MKIRYVGPFDEVEVLGQLVKRGHQAEFSDEDAGSPPDARLDSAHEELHQAIFDLDHVKAKALREEIIGLDCGSGLLAQPSNWQPVTAKKAEVPA